MEPASTQTVDTRALMREVHRYLAAVDIFRAEGREPCWLREPTDDEKADVPRRRAVLGAPPIP
jgi:hypothetical protein